MSNYQYMSVKSIAEEGKYPFTIGQMRHLLSQRHKNGLQKAVRKIGKNLLLRSDVFDQWIEEQKEEKRNG